MAAAQRVGGGVTTRRGRLPSEADDTLPAFRPNHARLTAGESPDCHAPCGRGVFSGGALPETRTIVIRRSVNCSGLAAASS